VKEGEVDAMSLPFIDFLPNMLQTMPPNIHHQPSHPFDKIPVSRNLGQKVDL
jgi:hypothetical protein